MAVSITKPQIGADADSWGTKLNAALDEIVDAHNGATGSTPNLETGWKVNGTAVTASANDLNNIPSELTDLNINDGSNGQVLKTDGNGNFSFFTLPAGTTDTNYYVTSGSFSGSTLTLNRSGLSSISISGFPTQITDNTQIGNGRGYITSAPAPTSSQVGTATSQLQVNARGTYAWLSRQSQVFPGSTYSSGLNYAGFNAQNYNDSNNAAIMLGSSSTPSGTWRCMGYQGYSLVSDHPYSASLFLKILN